jgi:hypothetical protein
MGKTTGPQKGEKFWDSRQLQPNGIIVRVIWQYGEREIIVKFYETGNVVSYEMEELEGNWTSGYGGTWLLLEEEASPAVKAQNELRRKSAIDSNS